MAERFKTDEVTTTHGSFVTITLHTTNNMITKNMDNKIHSVHSNVKQLCTNITGQLLK